MLIFENHHLQNMYLFEALLPSFPARALIQFVDKLCIVGMTIISLDFIHHFKFGCLSEFCFLCTFCNTCIACLVNYGPETEQNPINCNSY